MRNRYDLAIIGSGPGGYRAAVLAAHRGLKAVTIERGQFGGCCLNRGCVPKKTWYAIANHAAAAARLRQSGLNAEVDADLGAAWRHQRAVVDAVRGRYLDYLARLGVTSLTGSAAFESATTIAVDGDPCIDANHVIVATGSAPVVPPNITCAQGRVLTTDDLFDFDVPPGRRVAVLGAGAVATEFAYILTMLGCDVRWYARRAPLQRLGYSASARRGLDAALARHGITPRAAEIRRLDVSDARVVSLEFEDASSDAVDWVLLGTGRLACTSGLRLDAAGVAVDDGGFIMVDRHCRTSCPSVFAIGDVVNAHMSANRALHDAAIAIANIASPGSRIRDANSVPDVIYSAVEMARVGLNEDDAEARGVEPASGFSAFESNPAAAAEHDTDGFVRIVADMDTGRLLGGEVVGRNAGDTIQLIANAIGQDDALRELARASYNHPARGEEVLNAVEALASRWGLGRFVFGGARER